jgi:peptidoglycan hydrolase-like protein with peptidoglycan-binding domain
MALAMPVSASANSFPPCTGTTIFTNGVDSAQIPTTTNGSGNRNCTLGPGNASSVVRVLQNALNVCYGERLTLDGIYGPNTTEAVQDAQSAENVPADGIYGPQTSGVLDFPNRSGRTRCIGIDGSPN